MHRHNIRGEKMTYGAYIDMPRSEKPTKIDVIYTQPVLPFEQQIGAVSLIATQLEIEFSQE